MSNIDLFVTLFRRRLNRCIDCGVKFGSGYPEDGLCETCRYNKTVPENPTLCKTCGHRADRHGTHYDSSTTCRGDEGLLADKGCGCDQLRCHPREY